MPTNWILVYANQLDSCVDHHAVAQCMHSSTAQLQSRFGYPAGLRARA